MGGRVITRIYGGMGNQMFQYAAGRALALRGGSTLQLDCRAYESRGFPPYGLGQFNVKPALSEGSLPPQRKGQKIRNYLWRRLRLSPQLVEEKALGFDTRFLEPMTNVFLDGYWQSERYFSDFSERIREDFKIIDPPSLENALLLKQIDSCEAVSLHIRRGDYLTPKNQAVHGTCSMEYYTNAIELIASKITEQPVVFAFSDDPDWVESNLDLPFETSIMRRNGPGMAHEDLRLMAACRHHVTANSSFSWWGAWLSPSPDKIVVAPKRWFADPSYHNPDITPESWYRLDN